MSKKEELTKWLEVEIKNPDKWDFENFVLKHRDTNIVINKWEVFAEIKTSARDLGEQEKTISISYTKDFTYNNIEKLIGLVIERQEEETAGTILRSIDIPF